VAESLGGQVLCSNNEDLGATFSMLLPLWHNPHNFNISS
jgi:signal transduction histidine kinase